MLTVLSPAKSLDLQTPVPAAMATQPAFLDDAVKLAKRAAKLKPAVLRALMHISEPLAELNAARLGLSRRHSHLITHAQRFIPFTATSIAASTVRRSMPKQWRSRRKMCAFYPGYTVPCGRST